MAKTIAEVVEEWGPDGKYVIKTVIEATTVWSSPINSELYPNMSIIQAVVYELNMEEDSIFAQIIDTEEFENLTKKVKLYRVYGPDEEIPFNVFSRAGTTSYGAKAYLYPGETHVLVYEGETAF